MKGLLLLLFCATAGAQTFDYLGSPMTGSLDTLSPGALEVTTNPITGFLTAEVTLSSGLLTAYSATFNASNGMLWSLGVYPKRVGYGLVTDLTFAPDGAGFDLAVNNRIYHQENMTVGIGPADTFSYVNGWAGADGTCQNQLTGRAYSGPPELCAVSAVGTKGVWTKAAAVAAPEIDPKGGVAAFLILAFGLAVIRGRER